MRTSAAGIGGDDRIDQEVIDAAGMAVMDLLRSSERAAVGAGRMSRPGPGVHRLHHTRFILVGNGLHYLMKKLLSG